VLIINFPPAKSKNNTECQLEASGINLHHTTKSDWLDTKLDLILSTKVYFSDSRDSGSKTLPISEDTTQNKSKYTQNMHN